LSAFLPDNTFTISNKQLLLIALFLVLIVSLIVAGFFLGGFIWSVRNDQFEDRQGAAMRMLYDDEPTAAKRPKNNIPPNTNNQ